MRHERPHPCYPSWNSAFVVLWVLGLGFDCDWSGAMNKLGMKRLLRLADILDTVPSKQYNHGAWTHECGTPACALGHWAANNRRRWTFGVANGHGKPPTLKNKRLSPLVSAMTDFDIDFDDSADLFANGGCDCANTAKQAARYIRAFVKRKQLEQP